MTLRCADLVLHVYHTTPLISPRSDPALVEHLKCRCIGGSRTLDKNMLNKCTLSLLFLKCVATTSKHIFDCYYMLKHTTTLFALSDHYILSGGWRVIVDQVQTNYHGMVDLWCYNQSGVSELLIIRDSHYGRMCFKLFKTLGALHFHG